MKTIITTKELEMPMGIMAEVAEMLIDNEITHTITGADISSDTITIEVNYEREERNIIHAIEDLIEDYQDDEDDDESEEEDDDE